MKFCRKKGWPFQKFMHSLIGNGYPAFRKIMSSCFQCAGQKSWPALIHWKPASRYMTASISIVEWPSVWKGSFYMHQLEVHSFGRAIFSRKLLPCDYKPFATDNTLVCGWRFEPAGSINVHLDNFCLFWSIHFRITRKSERNVNSNNLMVMYKWLYDHCHKQPSPFERVE